MKYTKEYLKQLLKDNEVQFNQSSLKPKLLFQVFEAGLLKPEDVFPPVNPKKYEYIHKPMKVTYTDTETGQVTTYDSINKASKARKRGHGFYLVRNRQDEKYLITVETDEKTAV